MRTLKGISAGVTGAAGVGQKHLTPLPQPTRAHVPGPPSGLETPRHPLSPQGQGASLPEGHKGLVPARDSVHGREDGGRGRAEQ